MKYRKKPVEIEAIKWDGTNFDELFKFTDADNNYGIIGMKDEDLMVRTLEGIMKATIGDYIIKGVKGEIYPCKPDIFALTYDDVEKEDYEKEVMARELGVKEPISQELSYGQKLVGLTFNPSGDSKVQRAKELCAELADLVYDHWCRDAYSEKSSLENQLYNHTMGEILNAQMNVVKVLTLKY